MDELQINTDELKQVAEEVKGLNGNDSNILDSVPVPKGLTAKQIKSAKLYTTERMKDGFTISSFCSQFSVSTKSWYEWLDVPGFNKYLSDLSNTVIPDDERMAYQQMKKHLLKIPYKQNPSPKEVELFMENFSYLVEADKREQMERLGLNKSPSEKADNRTWEEKRNALLNRLQGK